MSTDSQANIRTVTDLLHALRDKDLEAAATLLDDDLVYENVGLPTIRGGRRAIELFEPMRRERLGFDVVIHRSAADGASVLNERTDALMVGRVRLQFWVCGVFEVHDGRITLWRDYFDAFDMSKGLVRGLTGAVLPSRRPRF